MHLVSSSRPEATASDLLSSSVILVKPVMSATMTAPSNVYMLGACMHARAW